MDYEVKKNDPNVSTTLDDGTEEKKWTLENLWNTEFTVDSLIDTLQVIDIFKRKYPNDDVVACFEEIVREELCNLFGGTLYKKEN